MQIRAKDAMDKPKKLKIINKINATKIMHAEAGTEVNMLYPLDFSGKNKI